MIMGGIKVAAYERKALGFIAYNPNGITNRWLVDAFRFSFSVFVFKDCSWVIKQSSFQRGLFQHSRVWDVSRRPRQKYKTSKYSMFSLHVTTLLPFLDIPLSRPEFSPRQNLAQRVYNFEGTSCFD